MLIKKLIIRVCMYVALFLLGLLLHILCLRVFVYHIGPVLAIWVNGIIQTVITIVVVHGLGQLLYKYKGLCPSNERWYDVLRRGAYIMFWASFLVHMLSFLLHKKSLGVTGRIAFVIAVTDIVILSLAVLAGLIPAAYYRPYPYHRKSTTYSTV